MIGEVEALIEKRIDIRRPVLTGAFTRMQQHVLDDGVGALAVLHDLFEIVLQQAGQFVDFFPDLAVHRDRLEHVVQFVGQFRRKRGEVVDEIERVLDLVRDASGELTERSQFLGLDQAILRGAQFVEGLRQLSRAILHLVEETRVLDCDCGLIRESLQQSDMSVIERPHLSAADKDRAECTVLPDQRHGESSAMSERERVLPAEREIMVHAL